MSCHVCCRVVCGVCTEEGLDKPQMAAKEIPIVSEYVECVACGVCSF